MKKQRALIIIKPDAVQRGLIGKIIKRFEQVGLTIVGLKFVWAKEQEIKDHYPSTIDWYKKVGQRTLTNYKKKNLNPKKILGTNDPIKIGKLVKQWLVDFLRESPVFCMVLEGYEVIDVVRKLSGDTIPLVATPGTIRGDFSHDNINLANSGNRPLRNIIHASDNLDDAEKEIKVWFNKDEIFYYQRADEEIQFPK